MEFADFLRNGMSRAATGGAALQSLQAYLVYELRRAAARLIAELAI